MWRTGGGGGDRSAICAVLEYLFLSLRNKGLTGRNKDLTGEIRFGLGCADCGLLMAVGK